MFEAQPVEKVIALIQSPEWPQFACIAFTWLRPSKFQAASDNLRDLFEEAREKNIDDTPLMKMFELLVRRAYAGTPDKIKERLAMLDASFDMPGASMIWMRDMIISMMPKSREEQSREWLRNRAATSEKE